MKYKTRGVCAREIQYDIRDGKVTNVKFIGGCAGNATGLSSMVEGLPQEEVISRLKGITCGPKSTSCPDQLAKALSQH
jgi:uncharacterized protein (TIGR03905 family)